jgi:hypothetical protein
MLTCYAHFLRPLFQRLETFEKINSTVRYKIIFSINWYQLKRRSRQKFQRVLHVVHLILIRLTHHSFSALTVD